MKKEETFMANELINDLEKEGVQLNSKDKDTYKQILSLTDGWDVPENRSQEESWNSIEAQINVHQGKQVSFRPWLKWAASIAAVVTVTVVVWLATTPSGHVYTADQFTEITLPDGSHVSMDIGTTVRYQEANSGKRKVELAGLAYFDVVKGKPFQVKTENGIVEVLGTSFNVNSFGKELKVECLTGKVVVEANESMAVLTPGSMIKTTEGELGFIESFDIENGMSWMTGEFYYKNALLSEVITEIERQFDVDISLKLENNNRTYSGLFSNKDKIEETLKLITVPMGLTYNQVGNRSYQVTD